MKYALMSLSILFFICCNKECPNPETMPPDIRDTYFLIESRWFYPTDFNSDGKLDTNQLQFLQACDLDDTYTFIPESFTFIKGYGRHKCRPDDADISSTYRFGGHKIIVFNATYYEIMTYDSMSFAAFWPYFDPNYGATNPIMHRFTKIR